MRLATIPRRFKKKIGLLQNSVTTIIKSSELKAILSPHFVLKVMVQVLSATSIYVSRHGAITGSNQKRAKGTVFGPHEESDGVCNT